MLEAWSMKIYALSANFHMGTIHGGLGPGVAGTIDWIVLMVTSDIVNIVTEFIHCTIVNKADTSHMFSIMRPFLV